MDALVSHLENRETERQRDKERKGGGDSSPKREFVEIQPAINVFSLAEPKWLRREAPRMRHMTATWLYH